MPLQVWDAGDKAAVWILNSNEHVAVEKEQEGRQNSQGSHCSSGEEQKRQSEIQQATRKQTNKTSMTQQY